MCNQTNGIISVILVDETEWTLTQCDSTLLHTHRKSSWPRSVQRPHMHFARVLVSIKWEEQENVAQSRNQIFAVMCRVFVCQEGKIFCLATLPWPSSTRPKVSTNQTLSPCQLQRRCTVADQDLWPSLEAIVVKVSVALLLLMSLHLWLYQNEVLLVKILPTVCLNGDRRAQGVPTS